ncbi:MAG: hypothetical protein RLY97_971, partial [Pseudomonadota bacterium]
MKIGSIGGYILRFAGLVAMTMAFAGPAYAEVDNLEYAISYNKNAKSFADTASSFYRSENYVEACKTFKQALESAGKALSYEQAYQAQLDRHGNLDLHRGDKWAEAVYGNMTIACAKANGPPPFDHVAVLKDLQGTLNALNDFSNIMVAEYKKGKLASACISSQTSADYYEKVKVNAHTYLEKTTQPDAQRARINIMQIDLNTVRAAKDRDEFYC